MLGAQIACRLKYICLHTDTNTRLPLRLTGRIYQHVESQMNINPHPPRGAALCSPGSSAWHFARCLLLSCGRGNYPSFLCVCVQALVCMLCTRVWRLHRYYLSYLFSVLATGQPATCEVGWLVCFPGGSWARHRVCSWPMIMRKAVRAAA